MSLHSQNVGSFHEQALLDIACEKFSDEIDEYKVAALHLMVDKAFANPWTNYMRYKLENNNAHVPYNRDWNEVDYYGCRPAADYKLTRTALQDFMENGIDYNKCTDPAQVVGEGFAGTFAEHNEEFWYLKSVIFSGADNLYVFSMVWDGGFAKLIKELGTYKDYPLADICEVRIDNMLDVYGAPVNWKWIDNT